MPHQNPGTCGNWHSSRFASGDPELLLSNDFRDLKGRRILATTDLDSGESIRFGRPRFDHIAISKASGAGIVSVGGNQYPAFLDGALKKALHASIVLEEGVDVLICLNPILPYNAKIMYAPGKLSESGLLTMLLQTLRAIIHSRVEIGIASYAAS